MYDTDGKPCPPTGAPPPTTTSLCLDTQRRPSSDDHSHANDLGDPPPYFNCSIQVLLYSYAGVTRNDDNFPQCHG